MPEKYLAPTIDPKPTDYLEMGGAELLLPAVQEIKEALESGETFIVVGGGGSGKSESMATAFEAQRKPHDVLDLRTWTVDRLADETIRTASLADPAIDPRAKAYISDLHATLSASETTEAPVGIDDAKSLVKHDYWADDTYGIKYAESYLLDKALEQASVEVESDTVAATPPPTNDDVLILDEFDLGIGEELAQVEIENAVKLIQLAKLKNGASQLGLVLHPAAVKDAVFSEAVRAALGEQRDIRMIIMQYFPKEAEAAALAKAGIGGHDADSFMQLAQGLPSAYLDICTKPDFVVELAEMSPEERSAHLQQKVKDKIARNKPIIFDRLSDKTKDYLVGMIQGAQPEQPDPLVIQEALVNLYLSSRDGEVTMPPIVREVLARELGLADSEALPDASS